MTPDRSELSAVIDTIESEMLQVDDGMTVLNEAINYVEQTIPAGTPEANYFIIMSLPRVRKLLLVALGLLHKVPGNLELAANTLTKARRSQE